MRRLEQSEVQASTGSDHISLVSFLALQALLYATALSGVLVPCLGNDSDTEVGQVSSAACEEFGPQADPRLRLAVARRTQRPQAARRSWKHVFEDWGRGVAAGVLLSAALVHILPSSAVQLEDNLATAYGMERSTAVSLLGTCFLVGVLGVYCIDLRARRAADAPRLPSPLCVDARAPHPWGECSQRPAPSERVDSGHPLSQLEAHPASTSAALQRSQPATAEHHLRPIWKILLCSLSFHALSEGMALGLSVYRTFVAMYLAIILHKFFAGLALGVSLASAREPMARCLRAGALFAAATPCAATLARLSAHWSQLDSARSGGAVRIVGGLLNGIAAGSFLAISLLEIIPCPRNSSEASQVAPWIGKSHENAMDWYRGTPGYETLTTADSCATLNAGVDTAADPMAAMSSRQTLVPLLFSAATFSLLALWI